MAFYFSRSSTEIAMRADWTTQVLDQDKLVLLFINYMFFSVIVMTFMLFLMCLTQLSSVAVDSHTVMTLFAICFIMVNIVVADYLVHTMNINKEVRILFQY